jgi:hypothetical protein
MKYFRDTNLVRELGKTAPQENMTACLDTVDEADLDPCADGARDA